MDSQKYELFLGYGVIMGVMGHGVMHSSGIHKSTEIVYSSYVFTPLCVFSKRPEATCINISDTSNAGGVWNHKIDLRFIFWVIDFTRSTLPEKART